MILYMYFFVLVNKSINTIKYNTMLRNNVTETPQQDL